MCASGCRRRRAATLAVPLALCALLARAYGQGASGDAQLLFRFATGGVITTGPVVEGDLVWFISDDRNLYVFGPDGTVLGKRGIASRKAPFLACDPFGRVVVPDGSSSLSMINRAGQTVWTVDVGGTPDLPPAFGPDGRLYVVTAGTLGCLAANGRRLWKVETDGVPAALVTGPGGGPLVGTTDGRVRLWSPYGEPSWSEDFGVGIAGLATLGDGFLIALSDGRLVVEHPFATEADADPARPDVRLPGRPAAVGAGPAGYRALAADGTLVGLDATGAELWRTATAVVTAAQSVAETAAVRLEVFEGRTVALAVGIVASYGDDGARFRELRIRNSVGVPAIGADGAVYSGGGDWVLYVYRFERALDRPPAPPPPVLDREEARSMARSELSWLPDAGSEDEILRRLAGIEKSLRSGTIGTDAPAAALFAAAVALGDMEAPFGSGPVVPGPIPRGPLPRLEACEALGGLGSPSAVPVLVEVFRTDPEPSVRAAAARAVASIGLDPNGLALVAFAEAAAGGLDTRTALAVIDAIERLYRANGALAHPAGALALVRVSVGPYPREIRTRAERALGRITARR